MNPNNVPESPLPWRAEKCPCGAKVCSSANVIPVTYGQGVMSLKDAKYTDHVANAYPQMVGAMQFALDVLSHKPQKSGLDQAAEARLERVLREIGELP